MSSPLPYPQAVGALNHQEAALFSRDFSHNWGEIRAMERLIGSEGIYLFNQSTEGDKIQLPAAYDQFLPAINKAVKHEKLIRPALELRNAVLTVRQSEIQAGQSQQGESAMHMVHRDADLPNNFYTVSDSNPTQYYPHLESTIATPDAFALSDEASQCSIEFQPFAVVWASSMTYHRSPPMTEQKRRTFLRVSFIYDHLSP